MLKLEIKFFKDEDKIAYRQSIISSVKFYGLELDRENNSSLLFKILDAKFSSYFIFSKALKFLADFKWFNSKVEYVTIKNV